jgi:predicted nuclease of predicted toxin-antitoxin system
MKFLIDECVSTGSKSFAVQGQKSVFSTNALGTGASDRDLLDYVKANRMILVTTDKKFVVNALAENVPVVYMQNKVEIWLKPKRLDRIADHLKTNEEIIRA